MPLFVRRHADAGSVFPTRSERTSGIVSLRDSYAADGSRACFDACPCDRSGRLTADHTLADPAWRENGKAACRFVRCSAPKPIRLRFSTARPAFPGMSLPAAK